MGANAEFAMYGGTIQNNEASFYGGGICNYMSTVTIKGGTIKGNISGAGEHRNRGYGGGVCNYYGYMSIEGGTIEENHAIYGGGICAYGINYGRYTGSMEVSNCTIQNNTASEAGRIFSVFSRDVNITGCTVRGNEATGWGGGIYAYASETAIQGSSLIGNKAVVGGGLRMESSGVSVANNTVITGNKVSGKGAIAGGISFDNDGLSLSGKVPVQGNRLDGDERENNVFFMYDEDEDTNEIAYQAVKITGALTGSQIGVTEQGIMEGKKPSPAFTGEYDASDQNVHPDQYFTRDNPDWLALYSKDGRKEARLGKAVTVTYRWVTADNPDDAELPKADVIEADTVYTARAKPIREGYTFSGWFTDAACTALYEDGAVLNEDTTLYGRWLLNTIPVTPTAAAYRVEHCRENPDGTYTLAETEFPLYGSLGETVAAVEKRYEHYHVNRDRSVLSGTVSKPKVENGEVKLLTLQVYYALDTVTGSYDLNGGTGAQGIDYAAEAVKYGASITVKAAPHREGDIFTGWSIGGVSYQPNDAMTVTKNITLVAQWTDSVPQTGDTSNLSLWLALLFVSGAGLAGTALYRRKGRYGNNP